MPVQYRNVDIFESGANVLVNPVNCVGVSGAGLAKQFAQKFPSVDEEYQRSCEFGHVRIGTPQWIGTTCTGTLPDYQYVQFIIAFPTKYHWRDQSQLQWIKSGLSKFKEQITIANQTWIGDDPLSFAVPPLGCGLGGLDWKDVKPLIEYYLNDLPNDIIVIPK